MGGSHVYVPNIPFNNWSFVVVGRSVWRTAAAVLIGLFISTEGLVVEWYFFLDS
jgi:hypothetical protein